jgi:type VI secretion system secreted protein Hcp
MFEYFLAIDGIPGESTAKDFERQIEVQRWSWSQEFPPAMRAESEEQRPALTVGPLRVAKSVDKATPKLMVACSSRQIFPRAVLTCRSTGEREVDLLRMTLSDLQISSYGASGMGGTEERPAEEIGITFGRIEFETTELRADGTAAGVIRSGWDVRADEFC